MSDPHTFKKYPEWLRDEGAAAQDRQTGIAIRFIRQFDAERDREASLLRARHEAMRAGDFAAFDRAQNALTPRDITWFNAETLTRIYYDPSTWFAFRWGLKCGPLTLYLVTRGGVGWTWRAGPGHELHGSRRWPWLRVWVAGRGQPLDLPREDAVVDTAASSSAEDSMK